MTDNLIAVTLIGIGVILSSAGAILLPPDKLITYLPIPSGLIASGTTFLQRKNTQ